MIIELALEDLAKTAVIFETLQDLGLVNIEWLYFIFALALLGFELLLGNTLHLTIL
jgi:hypothetical protein